MAQRRVATDTGQGLSPRTGRRMPDGHRSVLRQLALATGERAFLIRRAETGAICVLSEQAERSLRSEILRVGMRFPLGISSGGVALLALQTSSFVEAYLDENDFTAEWGPLHSAGHIRKRVVDARADGYSLNDGLVVDGNTGISAAVRHSEETDWALTVTVARAELSPARMTDLVSAVRESACALAEFTG